MSLTNEAIIDRLNPLPKDVYNYTKVRLELLKKTDKAVMIWYEEQNKWIPLSVLCVDRNRNIWMANWFMDKEKIYL